MPGYQDKYGGIYYSRFQATEDYNLKQYYSFIDNKEYT